ncbi:MAG TPA: TIR domain-containing protein [Anaerolineae bacterium]|nr:TIR domain-containing protein [Anaerolineae bacterium]
MSRQADQPYDVFISYSPKDQAWVRDWLLPRLEKAGFGVAVDFRDFVVGMPRIENIERAIENSRRTIVVLTPDWLDSEWNAFEALLLRTTDPAARRRKLMPVLLKPCELPQAIASLEAADFAAERHWERQCQRLIRDVEDVIAVPAPWTEGGVRDVARWKRWLHRYRREARRAALMGFGVWLAASLLLQWPPFDPKVGWRGLGPSVPGAWRLTRAGEVLLVSTSTDFVGCDPIDTGDTGLWRSVDRGATWHMVDAPLAFDRPNQGCVLAAIKSFAHAPDLAQRIYAATSDVGLLRSDTAGETWTRIDTDGLPAQLQTVAVAPDDPDHVFVGAEQGGVYRSVDGGVNWDRLDGADTCPTVSDGRGTLPVNLPAGAIMTTAGALFVGTDSGLDNPSPEAGLYVSRDGGDCWERIDDAEQRYSYRALAEAPGAADQVLALAFDHFHVEGKAAVHLWRIQLGRGRVESLWESGHATTSLHVVPGNPPTWYVVTDVGEVFHGSVFGAGKPEQLPSITRCSLPPTCFTDLAPDFQSDVPMLLANDQVYRREFVPWYSRIWP